ncbi:MAG: sigma-54-dependent Fis family transcriptional regulator, partial [Deltaproteobacteria bacterium]|nr:sigma-54-dependent Fis family transcriptional regulator [Deltaproteobacteria bacterium]
NTGRWITPAELPQNIVQVSKVPSHLEEATLSIKKASKNLERDLIEKVLKLTGGNRSQAARILEISRPILISRIKEFNLEL